MPNLFEQHLTDLRKSGISDAMIENMGIRSLNRSELFDLLQYGNLPIQETGYIIPYFDKEGRKTKELNVRLMAGIPVIGDDGEPTSKVRKYLKPNGSENFIYWPPGVHELLGNQKFCVVTEGEKKAAKAVQDGIPCIAISGVWNWADKQHRDSEKKLGKAVSYRTMPLLDLQELASEKRLILLFDSDSDTNPQVQAALKHLRDALLFYGATWVRKMQMPSAPKPPSEVEPKPNDAPAPKVGLDDFLMSDGGVSALVHELEAVNLLETNRLTPLAVIPYGRARDGSPLNFIIPNSTPANEHQAHQVYKQVEELQEASAKGAPKVYITKNVVVANTRLWCSRVITDLDRTGEQIKRFEVAYVPLTGRTPMFKRGDANILNVNNRDDQYAHHGAGILLKDRAAVCEIFHACQSSGYAKASIGTSRRGWVSFPTPHGHMLGFMKPQGVITQGGFFLGDRNDCPLLPIPNGSEDAVLGPGLVQKGDSKNGAIIMHEVLSHQLPALMCASAVAGLLLHSCPGSENFIVHLYGASSGGKTTALRAAASLFGDPDQLLKQWRTTDNGLEAALVARNDMAIFLDETGQQNDQEMLNSSAYLIANGKQKGRAGRDGSEREIRRFNIVALSTGEQTLLRGPINGGQETRTIQLPGDLAGPLWGKLGADEIELLTKKLSAHHGWALEPLVHRIIYLNRKHEAYFASRMAAYLGFYRDSLKDLQPTQIVLRRAKAYALITVALELLLTVCLELLEEKELAKVVDARIASFQEVVKAKLLVLPSDQYQVDETTTMVQHYYEQLLVNCSRIDGMVESQKIVGDTCGYKVDDLIGILPIKFEMMAGNWGTSRMLKALQDAKVLECSDVEASKYGKKHSMRVGKGKSIKLYVISYDRLAAFVQ